MSEKHSNLWSKRGMCKHPWKLHVRLRVWVHWGRTHVHGYDGQRPTPVLPFSSASPFNFSELVARSLRAVSRMCVIAFAFQILMNVWKTQTIAIPMLSAQTPWVASPVLATLDTREMEFLAQVCTKPPPDTNQVLPTCVCNFCVATSDLRLCHSVHTFGACCTVADVNECTLGLDDCGANSACDNTIGSYECTCDGGFEGVDGRDCTGLFQQSYCSF